MTTSSQDQSPEITGPFSSDREASAASTWAQNGRPPGRMQQTNLQDLLRACDRAGVTLGEYDRRILEWFASFEPCSTSVLCGLIHRAAGRRP